MRAVDLRRVRKQAGLTVAEAARRCGVSWRTWYRWERDTPISPVIAAGVLSMLGQPLLFMEQPGPQAWAPRRPRKGPR